MTKLLTLSVLFFITKLQASSSGKLKIEVLYESLCADSLEFIKQELYPHFKEIAPYVDLELIPFGKVIVSDGGNFSCQHGPAECRGNKIQSCVLDEIPDQVLQVEYVNCFMKTFIKNGEYNENEFGKTCAEEVGVDFSKAMKCYLSARGTYLQNLARIATNKVKPGFIPTIIYNYKFDKELQNESLHNFKFVVCKLLVTHPNFC